MESRRKFLKKALYVTPLILTVKVRPAHAKSGYNGGGGGEPPPTDDSRRWVARSFN